MSSVSYYLFSITVSFTIKRYLGASVSKKDTGSLVVWNRSVTGPGRSVLKTTHVEYLGHHDRRSRVWVKETENEGRQSLFYFSLFSRRGGLKVRKATSIGGSIDSFEMREGIVSIHRLLESIYSLVHE